MRDLQRLLLGVVIGYVVFFALLLLTGCAFEPPGAVAFTPPPSYRAVWDSAEACTGVHKRYDRMRFWVVPDAFDSPNGEAIGWTDRPDIYIAEAWLDHPLVVKHEMIHGLGFKGHGSPVFVTCQATWETWARTDARLQLNVGGSAGGLR